MPADLHVHTSHSDSTLEPAAVVAECLAHGIRTVAITDHDSVDGVAAAEAGRDAGLRVVPGVEMTAYEDRTEVHIVGLFLDPCSEPFRAVLRGTLEARHRRIHEIVERLGQLGVELRADDIFEIAGCGSPGRPHVAQAHAHLTPPSGRVVRWGGAVCLAEDRCGPGDGRRVRYRVGPRVVGRGGAGWVCRRSR